MLTSDAHATVTEGGASNASSIEAFGGRLDADCTDAFNAAIASRRPVLIPAVPGRAYRIAGALKDMGGACMIGLGRPRIVIEHSRTFLSIAGEDSVWSGLRFEPAQENTQFGVELTASAAGNVLHDIEIVLGNSGIRVAGANNRLETLRLREMRGTCIRLEGEGAHGNVLVGIAMRNGALAGILHEDGAHHNLVEDAHKWVEPARFNAFLAAQREAQNGKLGGDVCAYTAECHHNHARNVRCEDARDGCFTFSGDDNLLDGGIFTGGAASGCAVSGSRNKISNVQAIGCKTGFWVIPQAGGLAKDNVFVGCAAEDSAEFGFRHEDSRYRVWKTGLVQQPPTHFCAYGLNVYQTAHATDTFGDRPPTHTKGTVSDGHSDWTYIASDPTTLDANGTVAIGCTSIRSGKGDWQVGGSGRLERIGCPGSGAPQARKVGNE